MCENRHNTASQIPWPVARAAVCIGPSRGMKVTNGQSLAATTQEYSVVVPSVTIYPVTTPHASHDAVGRATAAVVIVCSWTLGPGRVAPACSDEHGPAVVKVCL